MELNQTTLESYNKYTHQNQGTLIGNWYEERVLRDLTGVGRTIPCSHTTKNTKSLYEPLQETNKTQSVQQNITSERCLGKQYNHIPQTFNSEYGTGKNKADEFPKQGKRIETIQKQEHAQAGNTIGRKVMRNQNGQPIGPENRDEDLITDHGYFQRQQFLSDEELKKHLPQGESYLTQQAITLWQEKQNDGCVYKSSSNGLNHHQTFRINNEFVKTFNDYSHVKK
ncbi:hypothetical protein IMG5_165310 [Ichthyophthirius multifiliis]|uniref:Uncharacterized protein n=1 Tax=Ichthyophthirius multifiliis TaxID=5932 RepID=G0R0K1_ICHMU|nr:hypothetical protein IMG5_165310 [Ichthyophthirius multifiliis]EGR28987.1 hypothetical protein IMG5_165310 [Ichthyophthirius multifiliis]|eukprot:XP_004030223.1 hypothetical protein IMG5_165310 [Ichthyophthirius multifiliis]